MFGGEIGPGSEVASVDGGTPRGERRRKEGGMIEGDAACDGGVRGKEGIDAVLGLVVREEDGRGLGSELG